MANDRRMAAVGNSWLAKGDGKNANKDDDASSCHDKGRYKG